MSNSERRESPREPYFMTVHFSSGQRIYTEFVRNISKQGMCVDTRARIPKGRSLTLIVHPPHDKPIKISGKVAWHTPDCMGVALQ